jgi:hypothetical protein
MSYLFDLESVKRLIVDLLCESFKKNDSLSDLMCEGVKIADDLAAFALN